MYTNDDLNYAIQRLQDTIIRFGGEAVLVRKIEDAGGENTPVILHSISLANAKNKYEASIEEYDLTPVPLGFINYGKGDFGYADRMPMRQDWRQGLRQQNCNFPIRPQFIHPWEYKALANTIEGKFPKLEEALKWAKEGAGAAFDRHFAVKNDGSLIYRTFGKVGNFVKDAFLFDAGYGWVEDRLKEALK